LDVTYNPLIALWFAVEPKFDADGRQRSDTDARLIVYDVTDRQIQLTPAWGSRDLPWAVEPPGWSRDLPYIWRPPAYNERIPAQDSAFLLGGIPVQRDRWYRRNPGDNTHTRTWPIADVRTATSVQMRMYSMDHKARYAPSTPTITVRIPGQAKQSIRAALDGSFGINTASVYPDLFGLAQRGANEVGA
jgi:hypothetical protein